MRLAYELCLAVGEIHPDYLLPRLTGEQWAGWQAYYRVRPFGQRVLHLMLAQLAVMEAAGAGVETEVEAYLPKVQVDADDDEDPLLAFPGLAQYVAAQKAAATSTHPDPSPLAPGA